MKKLAYLLIAVLLISSGLIFTSIQRASAATTFTVNSTSDDSDINIGDGICDVGGGDCTLRAAMEESNATAGVDVIEFFISGGGVQTINPLTPLPHLSDTVHIDGYSQPGSFANTAVSPNPLNGTLLIEVDGSLADGGPGFSIDGFIFDLGSENSSIRGLVINGFNSSGIAIGADGVDIAGTYIGTDPDGTVAQPNEYAGINSYDNNSNRGENLNIGGLNPEDRNLISGNGSSGIYPGTGWIIQGNYIGVDRTGVTALGNSAPGQAGGLSIDQTVGTVVGGTAPGASNVISGNLNQGLAPFEVEDLVIQGNFIGTDYTGMVAIPNGGMGINVNFSVDTLIGGNSASARNIISGNNSDGLCIGDNENFVIQGNYIGVDATGVSALPNGHNGLSTACGPINTGIIGGSAAGAGNVIAHNDDNGLYIINDSDEIAIVSNSIFSNGFFGIVISNIAPTFNDAGDGDTGANQHLNFPVVRTVEESGGNTTVDYELDVPAGDYRVEFFSNTVRDGTGYGEGETFIGYADVTSSGTGVESLSHVLTGVTGATFISMTTTLKDVSRPSGFAYTSEFGNEVLPISDLNFTKTLVSTNNIEVGGHVEYEFVFSNDGETDIDLALFTGSTPGANTLIMDFAPPDLDYSSIDSSDITCAPQGDGSASFFGPLAGTHMDYEVVFCGWTGGSYILNPGDTYTAVMTFDIVDGSDLVFTNYAFMGVQPLNGDPDGAAMGTAFGLGGDLIDYFLGAPMGNFSFAEFPVAEPPTTTTTVVPAPGVGVGSGSGTLPATGADLVLVVIIASALLGTGYSLRILRRVKAVSGFTN